MVALNRPLYKVSFHLGGSRGAGLLTRGLRLPPPPHGPGNASKQIQKECSKANGQKRCVSKEAKHLPDCNNITVNMRFRCRWYTIWIMQQLLQTGDRMWIVLYIMSRILSYVARPSLWRLRGHDWVHFAHRLQCTVTLNSNFTILKTWNCFQLEWKNYMSL